MVLKTGRLGETEKGAKLYQRVLSPLFQSPAIQDEKVLGKISTRAIGYHCAAPTRSEFHPVISARSNVVISIWSLVMTSSFNSSSIVIANPVGLFLSSGRTVSQAQGPRQSHAQRSPIILLMELR